MSGPWSRVFIKTLKYASATTVIGTAAVTSAYLITTRQTTIETLPSDYIDPSPTFKNFNPRPNPVTSDIATRRVPLSKFPVDMRDHLRNGDGKELTRRFCAGIWTGKAFDVQRKYLTDKYAHLHGREDHLWTPQQMLDSNYEVGTKIVDHFEVVESSAQNIALRCGDTPLNSGPREFDGLFSMRAKYLPDSEEVEFQLLSVFWNGSLDILTQSRPAQRPMPEHVEFLHRIYTKMLMESSVRSLTT